MSTIAPHSLLNISETVR